MSVLSYLSFVIVGRYVTSNSTILDKMRDSLRSSFYNDLTSELRNQIYLSCSLLRVLLALFLPA